MLIAHILLKGIFIFLYDSLIYNQLNRHATGNSLYQRVDDIYLYLKHFILALGVPFS